MAARDSVLCVCVCEYGVASRQRTNVGLSSVWDAEKEFFAEMEEG